VTISDIEWIDGQPRRSTRQRHRTSSFEASIGQTVKDIKTELQRLGVDDWECDFGNQHRRSDGLPLSDANPDDPGFALFWTKGGRTHGAACDYYTQLRDNMREVYLWFRETRMSGDRKVTTAEDQFAAAALPGETDDEAVLTGMTEDEAREVLGVRSGLPRAAVKKVVDEQIKNAHPDQGGSQEKLTRVQQAKSVLLSEE